MTKNRVIPQMFDVRPVDKSGNLDWGKINKVEKILKIGDFTAEYNRKKEILESENDRIRTEMVKREELELRIGRLEAELDERRRKEILWKKEKNESRVAEKSFKQEEKKRRLKEFSDAEETKKKIELASVARKKEEKKNLEARKLAEKLRRKNERISRKMHKRMQPGYFSFGDMFDFSGNMPWGGSRKTATVFAATLFVVVM
ncbi:MAG: hypothetical protein ACD_11C00043G0001, partial [uncultured bacterium]